MLVYENFRGERGSLKRNLFGKIFQGKNACGPAPLKNLRPYAYDGP